MEADPEIFIFYPQGIYRHLSGLFVGKVYKCPFENKSYVNQTKGATLQQLH